MEDGEIILWILGAIALTRWLEESAPSAERMIDAANRGLQKGGAKAYDALHPSERGHADDLPGKGMTRAQLEALAEKVGFIDPHLAAAVAMAESGGIPGALTRTDREHSIGLWQINVNAHPIYDPDKLKDPEYNAHAAFAISLGGTVWAPWSAYKSGAYRSYL